MREQYVIHINDIWECQQHRLKAVKMYFVCSVRRHAQKNTVLFGKGFGKYFMKFPGPHWDKIASGDWS